MNKIKIRNISEIKDSNQGEPNSDPRTEIWNKPTSKDQISKAFLLFGMCQSSKELQEIQTMLTPPNIIAESNYSAVWKGQPSNVQA